MAIVCAKTAWEFQGEVIELHCHCDDCRRNNAAPVVAWPASPKEFPMGGTSAQNLSKLPGVRRHFCDTCGSQLGFEAEHYPGGMALYAASLKDPNVRADLPRQLQEQVAMARVRRRLNQVRHNLQHVPSEHESYD